MFKTPPPTVQVTAQEAPWAPTKGKKKTVARCLAYGLEAETTTGQ